MKSIKTRILTNNGLIILVAVSILVGLFIAVVHAYYYGSLEQELSHRVEDSSRFYSIYLADKSLQEKGLYIMENSSDDNFRIELVNPEGMILMNTTGFAGDVADNTGDIQSALAGETEIYRGIDSSTGEKVLAASSPITDYSGSVNGVLRYVTSIEEVDDTVGRITLASVLVGLAVLVLTLLFSLYIARSIVKPVEELTAVAGSMAKGDYSIRASKRNDDEIGRLADTFNYMAGEINRSEQVKTDFIASVSHELRTPLTSIKGWVETLLTGSLDNRAELDQGLHIVAREAERLRRLVEELLDFSRLEGKSIRINPEIMDINGMIEAVGEQFAARARESRITLEMNTDKNIEAVWADSDRMKQVLINLLDNAMKFTPEDGIIVIATQLHDNKVLISVADNGAGIKAEDLAHVAEKFYKGDSRIPGSGLGLSICREIVVLHQGEMHIQSKEGDGTTVLIEIPYDR